MSSWYEATVNEIKSVEVNRTLNQRLTYFVNIKDDEDFISRINKRYDEALDFYNHKNRMSGSYLVVVQLFKILDDAMLCE